MKVNTANAEHLYSVIATIPFEDPYASGLAINQATGYVYVTLFDNGSISIIDGATNKVIDSIPLPAGTRPDDVAFNRANGYLYVIDRGSSPNTLKVIDSSQKLVIASIPVGLSGNDIAVNHHNSRVYVTSDDGNSGTPDNLYVIDSTTNTLNSTIGVGSDPLGVDVNPVNGRVYVVNRGSSTVSVIDGTRNTTIPIPPGSSPSAVAVDIPHNLIYVTNGGVDTVSVINGISNRVIQNIPVGDRPYPIAVNQYNSHIYVTYPYVENTMSVIDGSTKMVIDSVPVGDNPWKIAVNPANNKVYVTNRFSNTVSVISTERPAVCPTDNIQHWDKIVFKILSPDLAQKVNLTANTELDIKVLDDPKKVADIKQKVLEFLKVPNEPKYAIEILQVNYDIVCASASPTEAVAAAAPSQNLTNATTSTTSLTNMTETASFENLTALPQ